MNHPTIAVIGAGTMGAGIAQVAAAAGHRVKLHDVRAGAAAAAIAQIARSLDTQVNKGRLAPEQRDAALARLEPVDALAALAGATLAIEVIVEDLQAKQALLREIEGIVPADAVLASNTSSISITAIAHGLARPQRVVGMHFFNPVPQMKLVEVVSGADTDPAVAQAVFELARRWGKTPVHARSTPGFIVNRIARPYYAEALALLQEQGAAPATLDALARGAGFRMGPCELMDMIGHDVNYAVTQSVFNANYGDRRYVPSLVQKDLLDGGRLGRKSGRGFYEGVPATPEATSGDAPPLPAPLTLHGDAPLLQAMSTKLGERGIVHGRRAASEWNGLQVGEVELHLCDGRSAIRHAAERGRRALAVVDLPLGDMAGPLGLAFASSTSEPARALATTALRACGWQPLELRDLPGLWAARTVCMLINEAADAVHQGVCDEAGADLAMKLGTGWPLGPFEWLRWIGVEQVVAV
ncbi:MAG TPA: 3-hydroxyacyl-CoA dehydrogenase, partial [Albitalea sp.]|nr:3-hydroxyacyl-CoA dehydrogenase [Albitalea sp.]